MYKKIILCLALLLAVSSAYAANCGDTISSSTTLSANVTNCNATGLEINTSNVVLDCAGY